MAFPDDVLPLTIQLLLDGTWTDITDYVQRRDSLIQVDRGMSEGATYADAATCTMSLNNRDGRFSPRNALGPYYGQLGKNTPIRVARREVEDTYLEVYASAMDRAWAPDSTGLSITGDIDVRIDLRLDDWVGSFQELMGKWADTGNQRGWVFTLNEGFPQISWSSLGTDATILNMMATTRVTPPASGRLALRVTLDVNNGASGRTATFYTAPSLAGTWTQLGTAVTASGTTSIFDNTAAAEIGNMSDAYKQDRRKRVYGAEIRSGIAGTIVASPDFTAQTPGATLFTDAQSNIWTLGGATELTDRSYRFYGEVPDWPPRWDSTGTDVWVPIKASGITRRLGQGSNPVQSTLFRAISNDSAAVAYWPCEDGEDASGLSSATPGGKAMTIVGAPEYASFSGFPSSKPIPTLNDSQWTGIIPRYTSTGALEVRFILDVPSGTSTSANQSICALKTTGSVNLWHLSYQAAGGMKLEWFNTDKDSAPSIGDSGVIAFGMAGKSRMVSIQLATSGSNVTWKVAVVDVGGEQDLGGTVSSRTLGRATAVVINNGGGIQDFSVGHINVRNAISGIFDLYPQLTGYTGETAGARLLRLCEDQGVPISMRGYPYSTTKMGPQSVDTFINLIRECADANLGQLYEPRDMPGLAYRVREDLYNQATAVTLDYEETELAGTLEPTDDDRLTRNDVTVPRINGGSYRAVDTESPLSVLPPPDGVGQYDTDVPPLNLWQDEDTRDQAGFRLRMGTIDELRWTAIPVDLSRTAITGNPTLQQALVAVDIGDVLDIDDMPFWVPEDVSQLLLGYDETLGNKEHSLSFRSAPSSAYTVGIYDTDRYDTAGSQLAASAPAAGSSIVVPVHVSSTTKIQSSAATVVSVTMPAVAAGNTLLIGVVWDSAGAVPTISSIVDSRSNTYTTTPDVSVNAGTTLATAIIRGTVATALQAGDTITITLSTSRARWAIVVDEFNGVAASPLDKTASNTAASATAASGTTAATTADGELRYAVFGFGSGRTVTLPPGWTGGAVLQTAAGSSDRCVQTLWSVAGAAAAESVSITLSSSSTYGGAIATYKPITVSSTSLSVATTLGPLWTHRDGDYDVVVGGERMTVTNVTGSSSPQTFTVTRAVNGISKSHSAGEALSLAAPTYRAL